MKMLLERKSILARDLALLDFWDVTGYFSLFSWFQR